MCLRIINLFVTGLQRPLTPWGNNRHIRCKSLNAQLKTDLVVALAGAAVADGVSALCFGNFDQTFGNQRTRKAGAQQVFVLINRICLYGLPDVVLHKLLFQVCNVQLAGTGFLCLLLQSVQFARALANVGRHSNDFTVIVVLFQPRNDNRCVQPAGICQYNLFNRCFIHNR